MKYKYANFASNNNQKFLKIITITWDKWIDQFHTALYTWPTNFVVSSEESALELFRIFLLLINF